MSTKNKKKQKTEAPRAATGAEIVIDALEREGVEVIFGFPGGAIIDIFDLVNQSEKFQFVLTRHEQGAVHMAQGYSRSTGKPVAVMATSGPGATNLVTGLADALMDSIPLVAITGQVPSPLIGNDAFQEADVVGITRSATKHNYLVKSTEELPQIMRNAFHIAYTGRQGPTLIDIPKDIQKATLENYVYPKEPDLPGYDVPEKAPKKSVEAAAKLIGKSERPLLYVGGGVINSNASEELFELATKAGIPVTTTLMGLGAFPENHPLSLLMLGMHGTVYANRAIQNCDVLLAVGARFDDRVTGKLAEFAPKAKIVHIDIDPSSINKNVVVDVDLVGDCKHVLNQLIPKVKKLDTKKWLKQVDKWKKECPLQYAPADPNSDDIRPQEVIELIDKIAPEDSIITTEVGQHQMWAAQYCTVTRPRAFLTSGGLGTMGYGFPAAIGAQFGHPDAMVIDIAGDGSIQMTLQELATAAYYHKPVKVVILNNGWLGMVRQWQDLFYDKNYSATELTRPDDKMDPGDWRDREYLPDFAAVAKAYGCYGVSISSRKELEPTLREALFNDQPAFIEVRVTREENVYPMVPAGASLDEILERP